MLHKLHMYWDNNKMYEIFKSTFWFITTIPSCKFFCWNIYEFLADFVLNIIWNFSEFYIWNLTEIGTFQTDFRKCWTKNQQKFQQYFSIFSANNTILKSVWIWNIPDSFQNSAKFRKFSSNYSAMFQQYLRHNSATNQ